MFSITALAALLLPVLAAAAPTASPAAAAEPRALEARGGRDSGARFTFYDTSVGLGACGKWHGNDRNTVALNSHDLALWGGGYPSSACGQMIWVNYGGKTQIASIQDECPTCGPGELDLSMGLFSKIANQDDGIVYGSWGYVDDSW